MQRLNRELAQNSLGLFIPIIRKEHFFVDTILKENKNRPLSWFRFEEDTQHAYQKDSFK